MSVNNNRYILNFLKDLRANNSKEWMDDNRKRYTTAKGMWLEEVGAILKRLAKYNPYFEMVEPKKTLHRINNNRMFHPDKPVYKDGFSTSFAGTKSNGVSSFYLSLSPGASFLGGGIYRPDKETLDKIRAAIDYNGAEFQKVVNGKKFVSFYGGLSPDDQELKTSPKGYSQDHEQIGLLRRKNFTATIELSDKKICGDDFAAYIEEAYVAYKPMDDYLMRAITWTEE